MDPKRHTLANVVVALIMESLLANSNFWRRGRDRAARRDHDERVARMCAVAIMEHLQRCGIEWSQRSPLPPHRAGE